MIICVFVEHYQFIELLINEIRATNGSLFVSSVAKLDSYSAPDANTVYLKFEDPEGNDLCPFLENDIIMTQRVDLDSTTIVKRLVYAVQSVTGSSVTASNSGYDFPADTGAPAKGDAWVRIGNTTNTSRQGTVYMTSDDSNSPFIDTINGVASWADWTNSTKLKVRMGKLSGITTDNFGSLTDYGLYAKGGVYLESSGSADSIALKVESGSAQLTMKKSNETIFDFNTETSTAKISGFTIDKDKLYANNLSALYFFNIHGSGSTAHAFAGYGISENEALGVTYGVIPSGISPIHAGQIGILGREGPSDKNYFVLTDSSQSIAGWKFDENKLYNSTNIVLDGTNKKVSVNSDAVKMYYTDGTHYGVSGSGFHLGSYNQIAAWSFDGSKLYNGTDIVLDGTNKKVSVYNDAVKMYYTDTTHYGISGSGFQLGSTNKIANWQFDDSKLFVCR